jgi:hypothetical protein
VAVVVLGVVVGIGFLVRSCIQSPVETNPSSTGTEPVHPDVAFDSPFFNTRPGVRYVGDAQCAECHAKQDGTYHHHPMGRSLTPVSQVPSLDEHVGKPFDALGVRFVPEKVGTTLVHREAARDPGGTVVAATTAAVEYVVGSGTHAYSYLINRNGVLTQSPVTWYRSKSAFDLSPGFGPGYEPFERTILPGCLFCHANHADPVPDTLNRYRDPVFTGYAIGCERCHGPGDLHVTERRAKKPVAGEADYTIVNPSHLSPALREDVCAQCHLGGKERVIRRGRSAFDYRPGLPLDSFWRVFVAPAGGLRVAGHVEQMTASRCFVQSKGEMGCVSCHDPHRVPAAEAKEEYFRGKCMDCHATKGCTEAEPKRREKRNDCTACHMPRGDSNVNHVALTDHRILRRPVAATAPENDPVAVARRLVPFGKETLDTADSELMRDLAVGLVTRARTQSDAVRTEIARMWVTVLSRAVRDHPDDLPARESYGIALAWLGQLDAALIESEATLAVAPKRELVLSDAGVITQRLGLNDKSLGFWKRALEINPHSSRYRYEVANALTVKGDWPEAVAECRTVLAANGGHVPSRLLIMQFYWQSGDKVKAREEFTAILALHPVNEAQLRERFTELLR